MAYIRNELPGHVVNNDSFTNIVQDIFLHILDESLYVNFDMNVLPLHHMSMFSSITKRHTILNRPT